MITSNGKTQIKQFYARQVGDIAGAMAFGVGATTPTVNDSKLVYEVIRVPIISVNVDPNADRIVFRAQVQPGQINTAYEVGLWSSNVETSINMNLNLLSGVTAWTNGTLTNANARINSNALQVDYVANGTTNAEVSGFSFDLSPFADTSSVVVAYYVTTNLSSLRIRLGKDSTNYYEWLLPAATANSYNIARVTRSTATKTGAPDWSNTTYAAIRPSATAAGTGSVFLDGIRFESNNLYDGNLLVARSVLASPNTFDPSIVSDVEYSLKVAIA